MSGYKYSSVFFDFIDKSSGKSAVAFTGKIDLGFVPKSILDVGCGRGAWLKAWKDRGVESVLGMDGDYVDRQALLIDSLEFICADISTPFNLERKFDLVECLEVAEHISEVSADALIRNLISHGDVILFSAATPGQGGEYHVNEQEIEYWVRKFNALGYDSFDYPRSVVQGLSNIEPWYRYNVLLYANTEGQGRLSEQVKRHQIPTGTTPKDMRSPIWKLRCWLIRNLPQGIVNLLAIIKHRIYSAILA